MHQGQVIRDAVVALLEAQVPMVEGRVFPMRHVAYLKGELPALGVYDVKEFADLDAGFTLREDVPRYVTLQIEGVVRLSEGIENEMDALREQVELALDQDRTFGGAALDSDYAETEKGVSVDGDMPVGVVTLTYRVKYNVAPRA